MLALRWHGRADVRLDEIEDPPPPGPGEVRLRPLWCGICGTDVEEYRSGPLFVPTGGPHPLTGRSAPITLGHEFSGEVVAVGPGVGRFRPGDRVAADTLIFCGGCYWCKRHQVTLCERLAALGLMADGGLAGLCNAPERTLLPLPEGVSDEAGALAETLAVAVRALRRGRFAVGESVAVIGAGAVALWRSRPPSPAGLRRRASWNRCPDAAVWRRASGRIRRTPRRRPPRSPRTSSSSAPGAVGPAVGAARKGGRVVLVGIYGRPSTLDFLDGPVLGSVSFAAR